MDYRGVIYLNLRGCFQIGDLAVAHLIERGILGNALQSILLDKTKITDATLRSLARHCLNLSALNLYNCPRLTDNGYPTTIVPVT